MTQRQTLMSEGYAEALFFVSERDREYFWDNGGPQIIADIITYPDEGRTEKYEDLFIPENEPGVDLQQFLREAAGEQTYAVVTEGVDCELMRLHEEEWEPAETFSGGRWVNYNLIDGVWTPVADA